MNKGYKIPAFVLRNREARNICDRPTIYVGVLDDSPTYIVLLDDSNKPTYDT